MRFSIPITAAAGDIDELGHVGNQVYLRWVLDVAMAHSRARGFDMPEYQQLGLIWIVRRHELDYLGQVKLGEELVASTWCEHWKAASVTRHTEIARGDSVVLRAQTHWVMMSLASSRPARIPDQLRASFES